MAGIAHRRHYQKSSSLIVVHRSNSDASSPKPILRRSHGAISSIVRNNFHLLVPFAFFRTLKNERKTLGVIFFFLTIVLLIRIIYKRQHLNFLSSTTSFYKSEEVNSIFSPFQSQPPNSIAMDIANNTRHACIHEIRSRQLSFFQPFIHKCNHVLLVDPAYHSNVGDHMITVAELTLLQNRSGKERTVHQCSYVQAQKFVPPCDESLRRSYEGYIVDATDAGFQRNKLALWHGGGNFGNLWPTAQEARIRSLVLLLQGNYTIIGMPNSWYYTSEAIEKRDVQQIRTNILLGLRVSSDTMSSINDRQLTSMVKSRIIWTWREHYSFDRAKLLLPYCSHQLIPDIAFQLGPYQPIRPVGTLPTTRATDLIFLLRNDHESIHRTLRNRNSIQTILETIPGAAHLSFSIVDWDDRLYRFFSNNPKDIYFTASSIQLLSLGQVLICDRLHAALLAYLSNITFIYLDQVSGKISKTIQVAMESGPSCSSEDPILFSRAETLPDAIGKALEVLTIQQKQRAPPSTVAQRPRSTREERRNRLRLKAFAGS
jgi:exopolysaccharide biosynthesis predicted pyruvyltransferase EpsI